MTKKSKKILVISSIILVVIILAFFIMTKKDSMKINGYYDPVTKTCWIDKDTPPGTEFDPSGFGNGVSCCFNQAGNQIDCNNPNNLLAVYGQMGGVGVPGYFTVLHTVIITNTGSFSFNNVTVVSATWTNGTNALTSGVTALNNAWNNMVNKPSNSVGPGLATSFSSTAIDLQAIGATKPLVANYNLAMVVNVKAYGGVLSQNSAPTTASISSQKEDIGFSIGFDWI